MNTIPTEQDNPKGLHQRYAVKKLNGETDPEAEYFVLRLDSKGSDPLHIHACRWAIMVYASMISNHIPELSRDIQEKWGKTLMEFNPNNDNLNQNEGLKTANDIGAEALALRFSYRLVLNKVTEKPGIDIQDLPGEIGVSMHHLKKRISMLIEFELIREEDGKLYPVVT